MARAVTRTITRALARRDDHEALALPEITADLRARIGSSQIDEFVLAHGATDILRELVQNEFDGGGSDMLIRFGRDTLSVFGTGAAITAKGWSRLSVIMGTGEVIGDGAGEQIDPKENGIGSKNFGLRALFAYADRILVRSKGRMAVLDVKNVLAGIQRDEGSVGRAGVLVQAPYRTASTRRLEPFTLEREARAIADIEAALFPTLVKLATNGRRRGLRRVRVIAERAGVQLLWNQTTETVSCAVPRVSAEHRSGKLTRHDAASKKTVRAHEEIEFARYLDIPEAFKGLDFPGYFRRGGLARIAVSVPVRGGRFLVTNPGRLYYPLEAGQSRTGCAVSVSAPFQVNADRSRLIPSDWNTWLNEQAADLVVNLVGGDWFGRAGPAAYEALVATGEPEAGSFQTLVAEKLKSASCWPSADPTRLAPAKQLVAPADEALQGHLPDHRILHPDLLASPAARVLATKSGVTSFTHNSLVRLRCAGPDRSKLATKIGAGEADLHFPDWPNPLRLSSVQANSANSLTKLLKRLSPQNRRDLSDTVSTLSATGQLVSAKTLVVVPPDMWDGCPVPLDRRLHRDLLPFRGIARECRAFDLRTWVRDATERAAEGRGSETEREALYRYLKADDSKLTSAIVALVRRSPVLKAVDGSWAKAEDLLLAPQRDQTLVERAVPKPAEELCTRRLLDRFRIRQELRGDDLVAIAHAIADEPDACLAFEDLLRRRSTILAPRVAQALKDLPILRTRAGGLAAPSTLYLPTAINRVCLDDPAVFVEGEDIGLYRKLGCRPAPSSTTLLQVIAAQRARGEAPPKPEQFYPALVEALQDERKPVGSLVEDPVLWIEGAFTRPFLSIVSTRAPRCLTGAIPIHRGGGPLGEAYLALGASAAPRGQHWVAFFARIDAVASSSPLAPIPKTDRTALVDAYQRVTSSMLGDISLSLRWMLSERGTVHNLAELRSAQFMENDYPELADGLTAANANVGFAVDDDAARALFRSLGLKPLSHVCGEGVVAVGAPARAPHWFQSDRTLAFLHSEEFGETLPKLASAHQRQSPAFEPIRSSEIRRRLARIERIIFVESLTRTFRFIKRVSISTDSAFDPNQLVFRPPAQKWALEQMLATELARLAGASSLQDIRGLVTPILATIQADSQAERLAYLRRLGIQLRHLLVSDGDEGEELKDELEEFGSSLGRRLFDKLREQSPAGETAPAPTSRVGPAPEVVPPPLELPPLDEVTLTVSSPSGVALDRTLPVPNGPRGRSGTWAPRSAEEVVRDRAIGLRGEEIVYREELERVRSRGHPRPEEVVVWTAATDAGADHDIRSIGEDGHPVWIEVKSTAGSDGRFEWARREFDKAVREGPRYQLWRVYGATGPEPVAKLFADPIELLRRSILQVDIGDFHAWVEKK